MRQRGIMLGRRRKNADSGGAFGCDPRMEPTDATRRSRGKAKTLLNSILNI